MSEFLISDFTVISSWEAVVAEIEGIYKKWTGHNSSVEITYKGAKLKLHFVTNIERIGVLEGVPRFSSLPDNQSSYITRAFGLERFILLQSGDALVSLGTARLLLSALVMAVGERGEAVLVEYGEGRVMGVKGTMQGYSLINLERLGEAPSSIMRRMILELSIQSRSMASYCITMIRGRLSHRVESTEGFSIPWGCVDLIEEIELQCIFPQLQAGLIIAGLPPDADQAPIWMLSVGRKVDQPTKLCDLIHKLVGLLQNAQQPPSTTHHTLNNKSRIHNIIGQGREEEEDWSRQVQYTSGGEFTRRTVECLLGELFDDRGRISKRFGSLWQHLVRVLRNHWEELDPISILKQPQTDLEEKLTLLDHCIKREMEYSLLPGCPVRKIHGRAVNDIFDTLAAQRSAEVAAHRQRTIERWAAKGRSMVRPLLRRDKPNDNSTSGIDCDKTEGEEQDNSADDEYYDAEEIPEVDEAEAAELIEKLQIGKREGEEEVTAEGITFEEDGRKGMMENVFLYESNGPLWIPFTQEAMPEMDHSKVSIEFHKKQQCAHLVSDMQAFKAANPTAIFSDFIRWHSPRDYRLGQLSERMSTPGNLWGALWEACTPLPVVKQRLLWDHRREAEGLLVYLEDISIMELLTSLLPLTVDIVVEQLEGLFNKFGISHVHLPTIPTRLDEESLGDLCGAINRAENLTSLADQLAQVLPKGLPIMALLDGEPILIAQDAHREGVNALMRDTGVICEYELVVEPSLYVRIMEDYVEVGRSFVW